MPFYNINTPVLKKLVDTNSIMSIPTLSTYVSPDRPSAEYAENPTNYTLPIGIDISYSTNITFCVLLGTGVSLVSVQEWYMYKINGGYGWFAGAAEENINKSSAYIVTQANSIGFYPQITQIVGAGNIQIYASGDGNK